MGINVELSVKTNARKFKIGIGNLENFPMKIPEIG